MKYCPKCRSFYDDANLAFCQTDGVPLIRLNQSSELWTEGTEAIKTTREIAGKQFRIQKLKRFAKILVTTLITTLVIIETVRIIDFNPPTNEVEKAENIKPSESVAPFPAINVQASVSPTNTKTNSNNTNGGGNCNCNNNCNVNRASNCNCNTNCNDDRNICDCNISCNSNKMSNSCKKECDCPEKCVPDEIEILQSINEQNYEIWKKAIVADEEQKIKREFMNDLNIPPDFKDEVVVELNFTKKQIELSDESDCLKATVTLNYSWKLIGFPRIKQPTVKPKEKKGKNENYSCTRDNINSKWDCSKINLIP